MSIAVFKGNASGTGTVTLETPNTNSDFTIALPANAGTVITTASSGQVIPKAALPTGSVLQVVQASSSTTLGSASTSFVGSGFYASITPTSATSKVLVTLNGGLTTYATGDLLYTQIYRQIASGSYSAIGGVEAMSLAGNSYLYPHSLSWLDSPATTSVVNYQPYYKSNGGTIVYFNYNVGANNGIVTLTLMEIAA